MIPFFSVIIPSFNRSHTITRAIESVLKQSYQNFELIVVNDGSVDNTLEVLKNYSGQIKLINSIQNQGVSAARNLGIKQALGEWVAFLDSDDEWLETKLARQFDYINANQDGVAVHTNEHWVRNGVRVNQKKWHEKAGGDQFARSCQLCVISPSSVAIKKTVLIELGLFREDFPVCEDYDLWLKLTAKYPIGFLSEELIIKYGGHADQLSQKLKAMDWFRIKSLVWILEHGNLSPAKCASALIELERKYQILRTGYKKHRKIEELELLDQLVSTIISS
jgi:glycosyltransferase involved in cell wall biosynthesis